MLSDYRYHHLYNPAKDQFESSFSSMHKTRLNERYHNIAIRHYTYLSGASFCSVPEEILETPQLVCDWVLQKKWMELIMIRNKTKH